MLPKPSLLRLRLDALTVQRFNVRKPTRAYTLIELVLVVGIIMVLTGLVLSTVGYARKKAAMARAEAEIAAISAACENYKADNGVYPRANSDTKAPECSNVLDPIRRSLSDSEFAISRPRYLEQQHSSRTRTPQGNATLHSSRTCFSAGGE